MVRPRPAPGRRPPRRRPPDLPPTGAAPGGFDLYGFRVPAGVISPYARRDFVSHTVYDHTSVLKTLEPKWNLPALTRRDANANDLFGMVDLHSPPAFAIPPRLRAPANPLRSEGCLSTGPGTIPPWDAVEPGAVANTPVIAPSTLPAGVIGKPYEASLSATRVGRKGQWTVLSDDLPAGLVLDRRTGTITGVPTSAGSTGVTIGVSRGRGPVGAQSFTVVVTAP